jgi:hypothetical protein
MKPEYRESEVKWALLCLDSLVEQAKNAAIDQQDLDSISYNFEFIRNTFAALISPKQ